MSRFSTRGSLTTLPVLFVLVQAACSRPDTVHAGKPVPAEHPAPFQADSGAVEPRSGGSATDAAKTLPESVLPFHESQGLPAGTLLTVRLQTPVAAGNANASETFAAVVDEPVLVEGSTMLPRGAKVAGRVESAQASELKRDRGYMRLTLNSIDVAGQELPIQTSSLFVRANAHVKEGESTPQIVRLEGGRRLTFRLTESVEISGQPAAPSH